MRHGGFFVRQTRSIDATPTPQSLFCVLVHEDQLVHRDEHGLEIEHGISSQVGVHSPLLTQDDFILTL